MGSDDIFNEFLATLSQLISLLSLALNAEAVNDHKVIGIALACEVILTNENFPGHTLGFELGLAGNANGLPMLLKVGF